MGNPPTAPCSLDKDKMKEITEYRIPYNWQQQMHLQNFNMTEKKIPEFINFCKHLEILESTETAPDKKGNKEKTSNNKKCVCNESNDKNTKIKRSTTVFYTVKTNHMTQTTVTLSRNLPRNRRNCNPIVINWLSTNHLRQKLTQC